MIEGQGIQQRWDTLGSTLDERGQRLFAANEVREAGHGALALVSEITRLARSTINRGEDDLDEGPLPDGRVRRKGGGPKPLDEHDPTLVRDVQRLAEPLKVGDPMRPLKWALVAIRSQARRSSSSQCMPTMTTPASDLWANSELTALATTGYPMRPAIWTGSLALRATSSRVALGCRRPIRSL